jgi:protein phosphatase 4 regulatory subunit 3
VDALALCLADNTIITWMDADIGTDVALSFQEESGCHAVWEQIQSSSVPAGRTSPLPAGTNGGNAEDNGQEDSPPLSPGDSPSASGEPSPMTSARAGQMCVKLPSPELSTLVEIGKALSEVPLGQREWVATYIQQEGTYLSRLLALFRECEGEGEHPKDREAVTHLFLIMKSLIMMNDMTLIDDMMREEHFWDVLGCLEYDPDLTPGKANHRDFMRVRALTQIVYTTAAEC